MYFNDSELHLIAMFVGVLIICTATGRVIFTMFFLFVLGIAKEIYDLSINRYVLPREALDADCAKDIIYNLWGILIGAAIWYVCTIFRTKVVEKYWK